MPRAGFWTARRSRNKVAWWALLGGLFVSGTGCQHHHYYYYGNSPNCPPTTATSVVEGPVCDVPGQVIQGGTVVSSAADEPTIISKPRRSKVVVSQSTGGGRSSWKAS